MLVKVVVVVEMFDTVERIVVYDVVEL